MSSSETLHGKRIAFVVTDGFEQVELTGPRDALESAGAQTTLVSLRPGTVRGFHHHEPGEEFQVDAVIDSVHPDEFDAVVLPGGVMNPDALRTEPAVQEFLRSMYSEGKHVAAICHGAWSLIDAGLVDGKLMTSWPSLKTDLTNAGALWVDVDCVMDERLITSRKPDDIAKFSEKIIAAVGGGVSH